jgi:hypothetical protein
MGLSFPLPRYLRNSLCSPNYQHYEYSHPGKYLISSCKTQYPQGTTVVSENTIIIVRQAFKTFKESID